MCTHLKVWDIYAMDRANETTSMKESQWKIWWGALNLPDLLTQWGRLNDSAAMKLSQWMKKPQLDSPNEIITLAQAMTNSNKFWAEAVFDFHNNQTHKTLCQAQLKLQLQLDLELSLALLFYLPTTNP